MHVSKKFAELPSDPTSCDLPDNEVDQFVKSVVKEFASFIPWALTYQEIYSAVSLGYTQSRDRYTPDKGPFKTYANFRMRGAVLDELRNKDDYSRGERRKIRALLQRNKFLSPEEQEQEPSKHRTVYSEDLEESTPILISPDLNPEEQCEKAEEIVLMERALAKLPSRNQQMIIGYFWEEKSMQEIASIFGVTQGRISQLLKRNLDILAELVEEQDGIKRPRSTKKQLSNR